MPSKVSNSLGTGNYDVVSIGYPGPVVHNRPMAEPHNLGKGWVGFDFQGAFGRPVKIVNDAAMQALGELCRRSHAVPRTRNGPGRGHDRRWGGRADGTGASGVPARKDVRAISRPRRPETAWASRNGGTPSAPRSSISRRPFEPEYVVLGGGNADEAEVAAAACAARQTTKTPSLGGFQLWDERAAPCLSRSTDPAARRPAAPALRRPGPAAPRTSSAARSATRASGSRSASASSTRSITRASTSRRSAISASSSATATASGSRSSGCRTTPCVCSRPARRPSRSCTRMRASRSRCASPPIRTATCCAIAVNLAGDAELNPYVLLAPRLGTDGTRQPRHHPQPGSRRRLLTAEQGPFGLALAAVDADQRDAFGALSAGYVGRDRRLAGFPPERRADLAIRLGRAGQRRPRRRTGPQRRSLRSASATRVQAAATLAISSLMQPFDNLAAATGRGLAAMARAPQEALDAARRAVDGARRPAAALLDGAARAPRQDLSRRHGREPQRAVGQQRRQPRRLSSGLAARPGGMRHRAARARRRARGARDAALPDRHAEAGRQLEPEPVARRHRLLARACSSTRRRFRCCSPQRSPSATRCTGRDVHDMVRRALSFIARTGPSSTQDRWEENAGINGFTLRRQHRRACRRRGVPVGAVANRPRLPSPISGTPTSRPGPAVEGTPLAEQRRRERLLHPDRARRTCCAIRRPSRAGSTSATVATASPIAYDEEVSIDFLQLVRFGLRAPTDPLIRDSVKSPTRS